MSTEAVAQQRIGSTRSRRTALLAVLALVIGGCVGVGLVALSSDGTSGPGDATLRPVAFPAEGVTVCAGDGGALLASLASLPIDVSKDSHEPVVPADAGIDGKRRRAECDHRNQAGNAGLGDALRRHCARRTSGRRGADEWPCAADPNCDRCPSRDQRASSNLLARGRARPRRTPPWVRPRAGMRRWWEDGMMASREVGVAFGVLGPVEVSAGGRELELGSPQVRLLLAALLADANAVVSADRLIDVLWGDAPPPSAASSVQKLVYRLRSVLDPASDGVVVTRPPGYVMLVDADNYDAARFERLVVDVQALGAVGDTLGMVRLLDDALRLWRGPAFGEFSFAEFARSRGGSSRRVAVDRSRGACRSTARVGRTRRARR